MKALNDINDTDICTPQTLDALNIDFGEALGQLLDDPLPATPKPKPVATPVAKRTSRTFLYISATTTVLLLISMAVAIKAGGHTVEPPPVEDKVVVVTPPPKPQVSQAAKEPQRTAAQEPTKAVAPAMTASSPPAPVRAPTPDWFHLVTNSGKVFKQKALTAEEARTALCKELDLSSSDFIAWSTWEKDDAARLGKLVEEAPYLRCCPNCSPSRVHLLAPVQHAINTHDGDTTAKELANIFRETQRLVDSHDTRLAGVPQKHLARVVSDVAWIENQLALKPGSYPPGMQDYLVATRRHLALAQWLREWQSPNRGSLAPGLIIPPRPKFDW
jgi:hypothetical protein